MILSFVCDSFIYFGVLLGTCFPDTQVWLVTVQVPEKSIAWGYPDTLKKMAIIIINAFFISNDVQKFRKFIYVYSTLMGNSQTAVAPALSVAVIFRSCFFHIIQFVFIINEDYYLGGASCTISRNDNHPVGLVLS
jgi:hypothetical protein